MAINTQPPIPRAFAVEEGELDSQTGLVFTTPVQIYLRDLRADIDSAALVLPDGRVNIADGHATVGATTIFTPIASGLYSFQYAAAVNTADGVSSSLIPSLDWTQNGNTKQYTFADMNGNTTQTADSATFLLYADAGAPIRYALAYTSNTPDQMHYSFYALVASVAS